MTSRSNRAFRLIGAVTMAATLAVLAALGYAGLYAERQQQDNLFWLQHTYDVKSAIDDLVSSSRSLAIAQREYILNGSNSARESLDAAIGQIPTELAALRYLVRDNPDQVAYADELITLFNERLNEINFNTQQRREGEIGAATSRYLDGQAGALSELSNRKMLQMVEAEDKLLTQRLELAAGNAEKNKLLVIGGAAFAGIAILIAAFIVFRDLRRRLATERALRNSGAQLESTLGLQRAIFNSAGYAIIVMDGEGLISDFNIAAERMLGYKAHELIGKATPSRFLVPEDISLQAAKLSKELGSTILPGPDVLMAKPLRGQAYEAEWVIRRKDGTTLPVQVSINVVRGADDIVVGFLLIASDITERKKVERLKNEFVSTVSHELRTPLTSIRGSLGLVLGGVAGELPVQAKTLIEIAHNNAERLGRLINDILDIEKIESGKMEFRMKRQPLAPLLRQAIDNNVDYGRQFGVSFRLADEALDAEVNVDADRFLQVMANLLSNAAKFSPQGAAVDVAAVLDGRNVAVSVADKGKGIAPEFRDHIFEKFAQADSSDTRQKGGTGLGLSITKAMVEHMGGRIGFRSVPDQGTTFTFELPALGLPQSVTDTARPRVLICEDDADIALLLRMMLDQGGFDGDIVGTAAEAKTRLADGTPYIALTLDIALPDQTGLDLFRELRAAPATQNLPIVFVSAEADKGRRELNGAAVGVLDWLQKPIDAQRLLHAIRLAARPSTGAATVLHVEDDADLILVVSNIVQPIARLDAAHSLAEARDKLAGDTPYDLVLLDLTLPDGDGSELLPLIPPEVPVVIFSAREVPDELARKVASALIKSRTSNEALFQSITAIIDKMAPPRLS